MSKALIIKGADFSANYVTRITIASVPCTGIQFAQSEITISSGETATVEYTVTPQDTTDPVVWTSSDTDVVTVNRGVLTVVGIGTATITATCGNYSASAEVTTSVGYIRNYQFYSLSHAEGKAFCSSSAAMSRLSALGSGAQASLHNFPPDPNQIYPIVLPAGTAKIRLNIADTSVFYNSNTSVIQWMADAPCGDTNFPDAATFINTESFSPRTMPAVFNVPSGADAVGITFALTARQEDGTDGNQFAETHGITVEFLPAS